MPEINSLIKVQNISFSYPDAPDVPVLRCMDLDVKEKECMAILGESGSGKSTLLKIMCGLLSPDQGTVLYDGQPLTGPTDSITMIFQNYGLFPWKRVRDNILLPLQLRGEKENPQEIDELLDYLGLTRHADKYPGELSGGQMQRVALGRAVVGRAKLILMDEPFSALDIRNREKLQAFMKKFFRDTGMTSVIVTHSIDEALVMGNRIAVFDPDQGNIKAMIENRGSCYAAAGTDLHYRRIREIRHLMGLGEHNEAENS